MILQNRRYYSQVSFILILLFWIGNLTAGQIVYSVFEEVKQGTSVGNLAKDINLSVKELDARGFRIVSGSKKRYFDLNLDSGFLYVNERIDREQLCSDLVNCAVNLEAIVNNPLLLYRVKVNILDINDNSPVFPTNSIRLNVTELVPVGTRFPLESAYDADVGTNSLRTYTLSSNEHFSLDLQTNNDKTISAELVLQKSLDREKQPLVQLELTAVDGGTPPKSGNLFIAINVLDANDNSPVFNQSVYKVSVREDVPRGITIIQLKATDLDEGSNGEVVYSLSNRNSHNIVDTFEIDSHTGEVKVKGYIDFEEYSAFEIRVQAADKGHMPLTGHCKLLVEVIDVNDNAPEIAVTSLLSPVEENGKRGTVIALMTVSDKDGGKNGIVHCHLSGMTPFKLQSSFQNYYSLILDGALDRERDLEYNLTVKATDEGDPQLSGSMIITVQVSDVNDNAPRFPFPVTEIYLKENSPIGSVIYTVSASDSDLKENAHVTYSLLQTSLNGVPISSLFNVNSLTGVVYAMKSFNYEEIKDLKFQVQATDSGIPPLSSNLTVNVFILDENDNSPGILPPYSDHGSVNTENIPFSADAGYFVAKVRAVDADSGYNALLSYHIVEPKGTDLFRISTNTGEIRTKRRLSENDIKLHSLVLLVKDNGEPSLSATVSLDVMVVESTAEMQSEFRNVPKKEDTFSDLNLYLIIAIACVSVIFCLSLLIFILTKCHKADGSDNRYRTQMITTYPDGSWSYSKTQQYDVCFNSDTLKSDILGFNVTVPSPNGEINNSGTTASRNSKYCVNLTGESKPPNADWRYSASLRAGMQSSVHMEESAILQGAPGVLVQNWPTVSSATGGEPEGGEVSPPVGAGINSNSWSFRYGPGPGHPQALKPGEVPEAFIIPGSPAIISIRQDQPTGDDKSDFITFGKKEETKKKKKKKKGKADKKEKGNNDNSEQ
ncbi:protocadherin alpha-4-like isoform X9 [Lepisosteus oculatus]|uniref:protocadherin alpha-4-like isoform X9 n=1 Tax=Lepisosteus oculatus TaxID=7918 RepID=UPI0035F52103